LLHRSIHRGLSGAATMGRKNIDRIERGVKKTDKHEEV